MNGNSNVSNVSAEIRRLRKVNRRNNYIIALLVIVLTFVSVIAIYVRFFG